jgi:hypothetical protein
MMLGGGSVEAVLSFFLSSQKDDLRCFSTRDGVAQLVSCMLDTQYYELNFGCRIQHQSESELSQLCREWLVAVDGAPGYEFITLHPLG